MYYLQFGPRPKAGEIHLWGPWVVYEKRLPLVWNSELDGNIITNCEQGSIYRGRIVECWNVAVCYKTRGLKKTTTAAGILGWVRTRYSVSTFLVIHSHNNLLRPRPRQLKLETKGNITSYENWTARSAFSCPINGIIPGVRRVPCSVHKLWCKESGSRPFQYIVTLCIAVFE